MLHMFTLLATLAVAPTYATTQPSEERVEQDSLPMSSDAFWGVLLQSKITYRTKPPYITAVIPDSIKTYQHKPINVSGFILPLDASEHTKHFLLSKRTPTCPFCPPGEPNEILEVFTDKPVKVGYDLFNVRGTFELTNDTNQGIFFTLKKAAARKVEPDVVNGKPMW